MRLNVGTVCGRHRYVGCTNPIPPRIGTARTRPGASGSRRVRRLPALSTRTQPIEHRAPARARRRERVPQRSARGRRRCRSGGRAGDPSRRPAGARPRSSCRPGSTIGSGSVDQTRIRTVERRYLARRIVFASAAVPAERDRLSANAVDRGREQCAQSRRQRAPRREDRRQALHPRGGDRIERRSRERC